MSEIMLSSKNNLTAIRSDNIQNPSKKTVHVQMLEAYPYLTAKSYMHNLKKPYFHSYMRETFSITVSTCTCI